MSDFMEHVYHAIGCEPITRRSAIEAIWAITTMADGFSAAERLAALRAVVPTAEDVRAMVGSNDYQAFLASMYWEQLRAAVIEARGSRCELCAFTRSIQVHHKTYEHHFEEHLHLEDLIVLCDGCHTKFHNKLPMATEGVR